MKGIVGKDLPKKVGNSLDRVGIASIMRLGIGKVRTTKTSFQITGSPDHGDLFMIPLRIRAIPAISGSG